MTTGEFLKSLRKAKGVTQVEAAEAIGIAVNSLRLYEADKRIPKTNVYQKIIEYYNPSVKEHSFFYDDSQKNNYLYLESLDLCDIFVGIIEPYLKHAQLLDDKFNQLNGYYESDMIDTVQYNADNTVKVYSVISNALTQLESNLEVIFGKKSSLSDSEKPK